MTQCSKLSSSAPVESANFTKTLQDEEYVSKGTIIASKADKKQRFGTSLHETADPPANKPEDVQEPDNIHNSVSESPNLNRMAGAQDAPDVPKSSGESEDEIIGEALRDPGTNYKEKGHGDQDEEDQVHEIPKATETSEADKKRKKRGLQLSRRAATTRKRVSPRARNEERAVAIEDIMEVLYTSAEPLSFKSFSKIFEGRGISRKNLQSQWKSYSRSYHAKKLQCSNYSVTEFVAKQSDAPNGRPRRNIKQVKRLSPIFKRKGMVPIGSGKNPWISAGDSSPSLLNIIRQKGKDEARSKREGRRDDTDAVLRRNKKIVVKRGANRRRSVDRTKPRDKSRSISKTEKTEASRRPHREKKQVTRLSPVFRRKGYIAPDNPGLARKQSYNDPASLALKKNAEQKISGKRKTVLKEASSQNSAQRKTNPAVRKRKIGPAVIPPLAPASPSMSAPVAPTPKSASTSAISANRSHSRLPRRLPGVTWSSVRGRWEAETSHQGIKMHIGYFASEGAAWQAVTLYRERMGWPPRKPKESTSPYSVAFIHRNSFATSLTKESEGKGTSLQVSDLKRGLEVDARDRHGNWCEARILEVKQQIAGEGETSALVHFKGWNKRYDSWLPFHDLDVFHSKSQDEYKEEDLESPRSTKRPRKDYNKADSADEHADEDESVAGSSGDTPVNYNSEFIGIWPQRKRWRACISHNGQRMHLGSYETAELAARAWDQKARELRGINTKTNFPLSDGDSVTVNTCTKRRRIASKIVEKNSDEEDHSSVESLEGDNPDSTSDKSEKKQVPWVEDLAPRSARRVTKKLNYRAMEKGNFNEVFALQLKAFRLKPKRSSRSTGVNVSGEERDSSPDKGRQKDKIQKVKQRDKISAKKEKISVKESARKSRMVRAKESEKKVRYCGSKPSGKNILKNGPKNSGSRAAGKSPTSRSTKIDCKADDKAIIKVNGKSLKSTDKVPQKLGKVAGKSHAKIGSKLLGKYDEIEVDQENEVSSKKQPQEEKKQAEKVEEDVDVDAKPRILPKSQSIQHIEELEKVGSGSGFFAAGEILAIFAGATSVDGEAFWLFECEKPSDGANALGFYFRKDETGHGRYIRDASAPRQQISVDSVMRDFNGRYVTFKQNAQPVHRHVKLKTDECRNLHALAAEIVKMQGMNVSGANTVTDAELAASAPVNVESSAVQASGSTSSIVQNGNEVLGIDELPMQFRTMLEDPMDPTVIGPEAGISATRGESSTQAMFSVSGDENVMLTAGSQYPNSEPFPDVDEHMKMYNEGDAAAGDKVASMFLS